MKLSHFGMPSSLKAPPLDHLSGPVPPTRFLSNGIYTLLITSAGTGLSTANGHALTRWRADRVEDRDGFFIYVRDQETREVWSVGFQPVPRKGDSYQAHWQPGIFEIERADVGIKARLQTCVPPDEPMEIRRLILSNTSRGRRSIELTTCTEVVLNDAATHAAHPAFSKLFLQTEFLPRHKLLLARRRARAGEQQPWMIHALLSGGSVEYETDRERFLGRCSDPGMPLALTSSLPLSGTTGNVLDPILSLRCVVHLEPDERAQITFLLGVAPDRAEAAAMTERFTRSDQVDDAFTRANTREHELLLCLGVSEQEAEYFQALAGAVLYGHPGLRAGPKILERARGDPADLTRYGISLRRSLAVLHAERRAGAALLPILKKAQGYWQALGLPIEVLVLSDDPVSGIQSGEDGWTMLRRQDLPPHHLDMVQAMARLVITDTFPDLLPPADVTEVVSDQVPSVRRPVHDTPLSQTESSAAAADEDLAFFNGYGGFSSDGSEYVIHLPWREGSGLRLPPRPWINVIANEQFGFLVSETGAGCTWRGNSREHRLTPWSNDPLLDPHGEAFYIRDEETGVFWSPLPGPTPQSNDYEIRHGSGHSQCRHTSDGLEQQTDLFTPPRDPVKVTSIRITNRSGRMRRLSLFAYYRLALGALPEESAPFVVTEVDPESGAVFARNGLSGEFADAITFAAVVPPSQAESTHVTGDRAGFIGRYGHPVNPAALRHMASLDDRTGAGLDACIAQQVVMQLQPGETTEVSFLFGEEETRAGARSLIGRYSEPRAVKIALKEVRELWRKTLSGVQITTPSQALDLMVNRWLPYQNLSCRIWARSALYQSGGAFGYRDQLQDASALVYLEPELTRHQILLHAAHQFVEGDVLHWWHPPQGTGLRTRFTDDLLWLPCLTAFYVRTTGDREILDQMIPLLAGRRLEPGEDEALLLPKMSGESVSLYDHCCRAIDRSLRRGKHGLPIFGTGDWNDGMNRVGREGKGESVWLGFFLYDVLGKFIPICESRGDEERVHGYGGYREQLLTALNDGGWDGEWYLRGYYDSGETLGSSRDDECRIDALAQAWSVLSNAAPADRAAQAMDAVERELISEKDGLIRLLTPPFENTTRDPGYIKGYVPGVRENGGQYTHAALWVVGAMAELGRRDRVARLLDMLNPINHCRTEAQVDLYRVEPYVIAADIYGEPPYIGRGGWTWYTGSAGWMYRVALESLLGFRLHEGHTLILRPCVPDSWPEFTLEYRLPQEETQYEIHALNPEGQSRDVIAATIDGLPAHIEDGACRVSLEHDNRLHKVELVLGETTATTDSRAQ